MSSILEALREIESDGPLRRSGGTWRDEPRRPRARWVIVALLLAAGITGAVLVRGRGAPSLAPPPAAAPVASAAAVLPLAAPAPPPVAALGKEPPPRARVAPGAPSLALATEGPAQEVGGGPVRPPKAEGDESDAHASAPVSLPGEPHVRLQSIVYSSDPDERVVTLSINHGSPVTLHEGESAAGIDVGPIMRDVVYLRHAGNIFAVHARR